jgi:hypothetical protein
VAAQGLTKDHTRDNDLYKALSSIQYLASQNNVVRGYAVEGLDLEEPHWEAMKPSSYLFAGFGIRPNPDL